MCCLLKVRWRGQRVGDDANDARNANELWKLAKSFICSLLPWQSIGRSNFDRGLHNLMMLFQERHKC